MRSAILWGGFVAFHAVLLFAIVRAAWQMFRAPKGKRDPFDFPR